MVGCIIVKLKENKRSNGAGQSHVNGRFMFVLISSPQLCILKMLSLGKQYIHNENGVGWLSRRTPQQEKGKANKNKK